MCAHWCGYNKNSNDDDNKMQIKDAYRKLCLQYHPDLCINNNDRAAAEVCFKEISAAYAALTRKGMGDERMHPW